MTALHIACRFQAVDIAALLVDYDADLNARDINSKSPWQYLNSEVDRNVLFKRKSCHDRWKQRKCLVLLHEGIHSFERKMPLGNKDLLMVVTSFI